MAIVYTCDVCGEAATEFGGNNIMGVWSETVSLVIAGTSEKLDLCETCGIGLAKALRTFTVRFAEKSDKEPEG